MSVVIRGKKYEGHGIIEMQNKGEMRQLICYKLHHGRNDLRSYKVGHEKMMERVACLILEDLVDLQAQDALQLLRSRLHR